jgi:YafQ family addiction module toxin component
MSKKLRRFVKEELSISELSKISKNILKSNKYSIDIQKQARKKLFKAIKKNTTTGQAVNKQVKKIVKNPHHFKPLRGDMKNIRRVHIQKSFVLTYEIKEIEKTIIILDFEHHDNVYTD